MYLMSHLAPFPGPAQLAITMMESWAGPGNEATAHPVWPWGYLRVLAYPH